MAAILANEPSCLRAEIGTTYTNVDICLLLSVLLILQWNGCFYYCVQVESLVCHNAMVANSATRVAARGGDSVDTTRKNANTEVLPNYRTAMRVVALLVSNHNIAVPMCSRRLFSRGL